jgi:thiosulfate dehydrogenase (quinone) large subunit
MENTMKAQSLMPVDNVGRIGMIASRLIYGYLWYTQLLWKLPPQFGCPADFAVSTGLRERTSGLCDWVGLMVIYSKLPIQADLVNSLVVPNMAIVGWLVWLMEAFVAVSLILGLFTRLGGLAALVQGLNLLIGIGFAPIEWEWTYGMLSVLGLVFLAIPTGRIWGLDALLRPRWQQAATDRGNRLAKLLLLFT